MHSREENRTQVGKRKTKHAHCRPKYFLSLEDCEQKQLLTHIIHVNAYIQSHAGVQVSRTHLQEHVVDMCRVLISVPTSPDRTFGNVETPRENKI